MSHFDDLVTTFSGPVFLQIELKIFSPCLLCHMLFRGLCYMYDITHQTCVHWMCACMFCLPGSVLFLEPPHLFCSVIPSPAEVPDVFSWQTVRFTLILRMKKPCSLWLSPSFDFSRTLCFYSPLSDYPFLITLLVLLSKSDLCLFHTLSPCNRIFLTNRRCNM